MNHLAASLILCALQASLFAVAAIALYWLLSRVTRASSARLLSGSLTILIALWLLAFMPLPSWMQIGSISDSGTIDDTQSRLVQAGTGDGQTTETPQAIRSNEAAGPYGFLTIAARFLERVAGNDPGQPQGGQMWPVWLAAVFALAMLLGAFRLLVAWRFVSTCRREAIKIPKTDSINALAKSVSSSLGYAGKVSLYESARVGTPATAGWIRPLIFLPPQWREWDDALRAAVLAHEIAHIKNRDSLQLALGQTSAVLHFYNPLVHWQLRRLRWEQEVTADEQAARVVGNRQTYLEALARMVLQHNSQPLGWLAPMSFSTQKSFFRRIEMLKIGRPAQQRMRCPNWIPLVVLGVIGIMVTGFRQSQSPEAAFEPQTNSSIGLTLEPSTKGTIQDEGQEQDDVYSGPQPGEKITPFKVLHVHSPEKVEEAMVVGEADQGPTLLVFCKPDSETTIGLMINLEIWASKHDGINAHYVMLTDDRNEMEQRVRRWAARPFLVRAPISISLDGLEGPGDYGLNRNVMATVVIANDNKVLHNFALQDPNRNDAVKILGKLADLLGKEAPTLEGLQAELQERRQRTRNMRMRQSQVFQLAPNEELGALVTRRLNTEGNREENAKELKAALLKWAGESEERRSALRKYCKAILELGNIEINDYSRAMLKELAKDE